MKKSKTLLIAIMMSLFLVGSSTRAHAVTAEEVAVAPFLFVWDVEKVVIVYGIVMPGAIIGAAEADIMEAIVEGDFVVDPFQPPHNIIHPRWDNVEWAVKEVNKTGKKFLIKSIDRVITIADGIKEAAGAISGAAKRLQGLLGYTLYSAGDMNFDEKVDFNDFLAFSDNYGMTTSPWASATDAWEMGDFDQDGLVGFSDFLMLSENY